MPKNTHAFSLVELSIVLVILGLLTGGILAGQNLIRAAEMRSVTTEFNQFQTAVMTFRDKYQALPGDMTNATDFWGAAHATPATCATTQGTGTQTCNGNGNGQVSSFATASERYEHFRFWQQLANAGLIEGTFSGIAGSAGDRDTVAGENSPLGKVSNSGWGVIRHQNYAGNSAFTAKEDYGHLMSFGGYYANSERYGRILTPEEVWNIDSKIDDGIPHQGNVWSTYWDDCTTATSATDRNGVYNLSNQAKQCSIQFLNAF